MALFITRSKRKYHKFLSILYYQRDWQFPRNLRTAKKRARTLKKCPYANFLYRLKFFRENPKWDVVLVRNCKS